MKNEEFAIYKTFSEPAIAADTADFLSQNDVENETEESTPFQNPMSNSREMLQEFSIKLRRKDFEKANALLFQRAANNSEPPSENHPFLDYTDPELIEVLSMPDEWNESDILLAQKILTQRGKQVSGQEMEQMKKKRIAELAQPQKKKMAWMIIGYICMIFGGYIALLVWWNLANQKKTLPDGSIVYTYSESDRRLGTTLFCLSLISMVLWTIFFYKKLN